MLTLVYLNIRKFVFVCFSSSSSSLDAYCYFMKRENKKKKSRLRHGIRIEFTMSVCVQVSGFHSFWFCLR